MNGFVVAPMIALIAAAALTRIASKQLTDAGKAEQCGTLRPCQFRALAGRAAVMTATYLSLLGSLTLPLQIVHAGDLESSIGHTPGTTIDLERIHIPEVDACYTVMRIDRPGGATINEHPCTDQFVAQANKGRSWKDVDDRIPGEFPGARTPFPNPQSYISGFLVQETGTRLFLERIHDPAAAACYLVISAAPAGGTTVVQKPCSAHFLSRARGVPLSP